MRQPTLALCLITLLCSQAFTYPIINHCEDARETGIYTLVFNEWALDVMCDMDTDGGGWLVIINRRGGEDFYQPWDKYANEGISSP